MPFFLEIMKCPLLRNNKDMGRILLVGEVLSHLAFLVTSPRSKLQVTCMVKRKKRSSGEFLQCMHQRIFIWHLELQCYSHSSLYSMFQSLIGILRLDRRADRGRNIMLSHNIRLITLLPNLIYPFFFKNIISAKTMRAYIY